MMQQDPDNSKPERKGGRRAGVPNRTTAQVRELMHELFNENIDRLREDLDRLPPALRVRALLELAKFVVPTLKAIDITSDGSPIARAITPLTIQILSNEDATN